MREIFLNTNNQASLVPKGKPAQLAAVVEPWLEHKEACKQQGIQNAAAAEAFWNNCLSEPSAYYIEPDSGTAFEVAG
ncbi:hypothetical protein P7H19_17550 [Paenibacillus larvae]|nr:hypothetical protein [Paenibacillus larvae]MDT2237719.1 hypothetical protein [Paenibacillus larvae]